jgi:cell division protein FtsL
MQTEKKGFSKREKRLMLLLVVFALFAVMVMYVIIPLYTRLGEAQIEYSELSNDRIILETRLNSEAAVQQLHDDAVEQSIMIGARFLSESLSYDIGRMLTRLCETHGLQPISQQLSAPREFIIEEIGGYTGSDYDIRRYLEYDDRYGYASEDEFGVRSAFLIVTANMSVSGEYDDLKHLLDTVEQTEYLRISQVSVRWDSGAGSYIDRINIDFEVIMLREIVH